VARKGKVTKGGKGDNPSSYIRGKKLFFSRGKKKKRQASQNFSPAPEGRKKVLGGKPSTSSESEGKATRPVAGRGETCAEDQTPPDRKKKRRVMLLGENT